MSRCLNCDKSPSYGFPNGKRQYCSRHKKEGMIDLKSVKCLDCDKCAAFGFAGDKAQHYSQHKKEGMINVKSRKDSSFSFPNKEFCSGQKKDNIINPKRKRSDDIS